MWMIDDQMPSLRFVRVYLHGVDDLGDRAVNSPRSLVGLSEVLHSSSVCLSTLVGLPYQDVDGPAFWLAACHDFWGHCMVFLWFERPFPIFVHVCRILIFVCERTLWPLCAAVLACIA